MLTCHLKLKVKSKAECLFSIYRLFVKIKHLPLLSTVNLLLVEFIHILTTLYQSTYKSGTVYRHSYRSLQICSRWTKLHYELVCLEETFLKIGYPKDFVDKCFKNL